jgi:hypothetical protein
MRGRVVLAGVLLAAVAATPAAGGDVTLFAARVSPTASWGTGYGAALSSTWFRLVNFEGEAARLPGELPEEIMTTFTGSAFLAPSIGQLVPYGGLGIGYFRQSRSDRSDTGVVRSFALGAKLKLGAILLRGEWRRVNLSGEPLIEVDSRVAVGVGINF